MAERKLPPPHVGGYTGDIMMLIKTRVQLSAIHGMGLAAIEFVARGTPVWRFEPDFDREFSPGQFATQPPLAQQHLRWFAYLDLLSGLWVLSGDLSIFMNHAQPPNTGALPGLAATIMTVALRDISAGEELTCDYFAFDAEAGKKLGGS